MDEMEIRYVSDMGRVTEKMADFVGSVLLQLMQKQSYVEQQGVKALLRHMKKGKGIKTIAVMSEHSEAFKELLKKHHIPYVEIEHIDPETKEKTSFFLYRDSDEKKMKEVSQEFRLYLDHSCQEMDLDTFLTVSKDQEIATVSSIDVVELYAFREAAREQEIQYCVVEDGEKYRILVTEREPLEATLEDMYYILAGSMGIAYATEVKRYLEVKKQFKEQLRPIPGKVTFVVDGGNPRNFISIEEDGYTTHSLVTVEEMKPNGEKYLVVHDMVLAHYPLTEWEKVFALLTHFKKPLVMEQEDFPLVKGLTKTKEAILVPDFKEQYEKFEETCKDIPADFPKVPNWHHMMEQEAEKNSEPISKEQENKLREEAKKKAKQKKIEMRTMKQDEERKEKDKQVDRRVAKDHTMNH